MIKDIYKNKIMLLCGDIILIAASIYLAPVLRFQIVLDPLIVFHPSDVLVILVYILVLYVCDLYRFKEINNDTLLAFEFAMAILAISIFNAAIFYFFHLRTDGSWILFLSSCLAFVFLILWRLVFIYINGITKIPLRVLILGAGKTGKALYNAMKAKKVYQVVGFADDDQDKQGLIIDGLPILGKSVKLRDLINKYKINKVIVATNHEIKPAVFQELVHAKFNGVKIYEMTDFYEKISGKIPVLHMSDMWLGYADICGIKKNIYNTKIKKVLEKTFASICLVIALPLMILMALAIKLDSPGSVFYIQRRIGWQEQPFNLVKFRSMCVGLEKDRKFAGQRHDPRITRVGKIMRRFRFDEIPQLWHVITGEMCVIGPRALMAEEVKEFTPQIRYFNLRHTVRPGITGWAQINYSHGVTVQDGMEKLQYDLYYIKNMSFILDSYIALKTVRVVMLGSGAR